MSDTEQTGFIREYWDNQARVHGGSHWASWGDHFMVQLEIDAISAHIAQGNSVLDIGCANGFSVFNQYRINQACSYTGVDFSEAMIQAARHERSCNYADAPIRFDHADVRRLPFDSNTFDVVYTTRVLINLPSWDEQRQGILESLRVVKPGGKIMLAEGFWEPLCLLNSLRMLVKLPPLVEHDFNRYIKQSALESFLEEQGIRYEKNDFSSVYYLGSRFLRELITNPNEYPGYDNPVNELFYNIEREYSGGGFGIQQLYVLYP